MKTIYSSSTQIPIIVDDDDYDKLVAYKWYIRTGYAYRQEQYYLDGKRHTKGIAMHREVMKAPEGTLVDHINFNRLDNCKHNLRLATKSQNSQNRGLSSKNTSGYRGVYKDNRLNKWIASIKISQKIKHIGTFKEKDAAALAYNKTAKELFGEFAYLNKVDS